MRKKTVSFRSNSRLARKLWGGLSNVAFRTLRYLTERYSLSVANGDLQFLDGRWYVTHSGLLQLAYRRGCSGIGTVLEEHSSDASARRWVFKATVYRTIASKGFVGYGDADPLNVSPLGSGSRVAHRRNSRRQSRAAQGLWHRALFRRGTGFTLWFLQPRS